MLDDPGCGRSTADGSCVEGLGPCPRAARGLSSLGLALGTRILLAPTSVDGPNAKRPTGPSIRRPRKAGQQAGTRAPRHVFAPDPKHDGAPTDDGPDQIPRGRLPRWGPLIFALKPSAVSFRLPAHV